MRSMRAVTRSPGIAPPTSTTRPSSRAIIRPPTAGFSTSRRTVFPGARSVLRTEAGGIVPGWMLSPRERDGRQAETVAQDPVGGGLPRAVERIGGHRRPERGELFLRLAHDR